MLCAEEPDDFYDFTPEDYYQIMSEKIGGNIDNVRLNDLHLELSSVWW